MNEQDAKAFDAWFVNNTAHSLGSGYAATSETAWQACCEYKDKQYNPYRDSPDWVQEAMQRQATIETMKEQLAAKDAVIAKLRQELLCAGVEPDVQNDDAALRELLKQAKREGQAEMRERQVSLLRKNAHTFARNLVDEARALPIDGELVGSKGENE